MEITKRIAIDTAIEEEIVKKVIHHSLDSLLRSSRNSESMEITGFGTFYLKKKRIPYYINNFEIKIEKLKVHLNTLFDKYAIEKLSKQIEHYENVLNEIKRKYEVE